MHFKKRKKHKKRKKPSTSTQNRSSVGCNRETNATVGKIVATNLTINISVTSKRNDRKNRLIGWLKALGIAITVAIAVYKLFVG